MRCKDGNGEFGNQHSHQKSGSCHYGSGINRYFQHFRHTKILLGSIIITCNRLHSLIQAHHNHYEKEHQPVHNSERPDGKVASVTLQSLIYQDDNKASRQVHQERCHTDGK